MPARTRAARPSPWVTLVTWACGCLLALVGHAADPAPPVFPESSLKAAFLLSFANYVEWPPERFADKSAPLVIGVLGSQEVLSALEDLIRRKPGTDRPRQARRLADTGEIRECHIVFVDQAHQAAALTAVRHTAILLIGEGDDLLDQGGHIQFARRGENLAFDIHQKAIEEAGLRVSSKVLALARRVIRPRPDKVRDSP